jgi:hypothetical protein
MRRNGEQNIPSNDLAQIQNVMSVDLDSALIVVGAAGSLPK